MHGDWERTANYSQTESFPQADSVENLGEDQRCDIFRKVSKRFDISVAIVIGKVAMCTSQYV
ncbi:predicted protein [Sclerotinia sclerotiorum 1980 UF-70]|uniref:Uncharacterized protein n=1 Tax=Sclerotinia sclerotiorum (strain ATCC 18683 / 1980 / Ss-1) TaxID=665079 RepID=A7EPZ7_SCLS1|nr:predicted protein [Sclerotinia sclerotiorum 1980 UF-70]EDO04913.1 predicted protein [Sclerotinia sclerotiorum 1980 UF-70]